jgi:hypothetical protein
MTNTAEIMARNDRGPPTMASGFYWVKFGADPATIAHYDRTRDQWRSLEWSLPVGADRVLVVSELLTAP